MNTETIKHLANSSAFYKADSNSNTLRIEHSDVDDGTFYCIDEDSGDEVYISFSEVPMGAIFYTLTENIIS